MPCSNEQSLHEDFKLPGTAHIEAADAVGTKLDGGSINKAEVSASLLVDPWLSGCTAKTVYTGHKGSEQITKSEANTPSERVCVWVL